MRSLACVGSRFGLASLTIRFALSAYLAAAWRGKAREAHIDGSAHAVRLSALDANVPKGARRQDPKAAKAAKIPRPPMPTRAPRPPKPPR